MVDKYFKWKILARILVLRPVSNVSAYHELDQIKKVFVGEIFTKTILLERNTGKKRKSSRKTDTKLEKKVIKINSNNWIL